jgi:hypothetical protein
MAGAAGWFATLEMTPSAAHTIELPSITAPVKQTIGRSIIRVSILFSLLVFSALGFCRLQLTWAPIPEAPDCFATER